MAALAADELHYRSLFEGHTAVILLVDPGDGRIVDANAAAAAFYGWPQAQLRGMTIGQINALPEVARGEG